MGKYELMLRPFDLEIIISQMKGRRFDPSNLIGVAKRCKWGYPQVLLCRPLQKGKPFPTIFWLSCPWLVKACGLLESQGGVGELESYLADDLKNWKSFQMSYALARLSMLSDSEKYFLMSHRRHMWNSLRTGGVGGIDYRKLVSPTVKCLHLQVAAWLALGLHPGESWLADRVGRVDCRDCLCKK